VIPIIPPDKMSHLGVGAILGLSGLWWGLCGLLPVVIFAVGKELWDHAHPPHKAEVWDAIATVAGGLLSVGLILLKAYLR